MSGWDKALACIALSAAALALVSCTGEQGKEELPEAPPIEEPALVDGSVITGAAGTIDGDTIEISGRRIRIDGIDAPESGKRCGEVNIHEAGTFALDEFVANRTTSCRVTGGIDRDGRPVAHCSVDGVDIGARMVEQGYARDWPRYSDGEYATQEAAARAASLGVWARACPADLWPADRDYSR